MSEVFPPDSAQEHPAADDRYRPGDVIGEKYRLIRTLGQGGFGTVWVAHNTVLEVHVAVKLIELEDDERDVQGERLLEEARAAARLSHPAIVRVFDFGRTAHGDPFVVMELLHGETLFDRFKRKSRLSATEAVQLLLPVADGLAAAHAKGIIHRDVKPENVVLAHDESGRLRPKLLDFGIARRVDVDRKLTAKGSVVGTPDYMSPEQARGETTVDERADMWSFAVVLYELIAGRPPFGGPNYNALLWSIIESAPVPITEQAAGDDELWLVIEKGLQKKPEERWESMRALGEALARWLLSHGIGEDVCGTSLRVAWLESSGMSLPPPSGSLSLGQSSPQLPRSPTLSASIADTETPPRRRAALGLAIALAMAVIAIAGFVTVRGRAGPHPEEAVEAISASRATEQPVAATLGPAAPTKGEVAVTATVEPPAPSASADAPDAAAARPIYRSPGGKKRSKPVDFGF